MKHALPELDALGAPLVPELVSYRRCARCGGAAVRVYCQACTTAMVADEAAKDRATVAAADIAAIDGVVASIPTKWRWATFDAPDLSQRVIRVEAIEEARAALHHRSVVLFGNTASGKTSLACAMLRSILASARASSEPARRGFGARAMFAGAYWIAKARAEHRLGDGDAPLVEQAKSASVLLLDDLGADSAKNTAIEEIVYERDAMELQTIFTTGFGFRALSDKYGIGVARRIFEVGFAKIIWCEPKPAKGGA